MEAFLQTLLPRLLPSGRTFEIHAFPGEHNLLRNLQARFSSQPATRQLRSAVSGVRDCDILSVP